MKTELPTLKSHNESEKITLYFDKTVGEIYKKGKQNGWDTPKIVREAVSAALMEKREDLLEKAPTNHS